MKLSSILKLIKVIGNKNNIDKIYICGGIPRDIAMNKFSNVGDCDITTGNEDIHKLAKLTYLELNKHISVFYKVANDNHISIYINNFKLDFSSNFISNNLPNNIKRKDDLSKEVCSRDFTCNSLLIDFSNYVKNDYTIIDITGKGLRDIKDKTISTILDPSITLSDNLNRIPRLFYMSAKLNFAINNNIKNFILSNKEIIRQVDQTYFNEKINLSMKYNKERTISLIKELDIIDVIPYNKNLYELFKISI
jgi:tRNA nucleotidyltransferase/poly(A) polymerase